MAKSAEAFRTISEVADDLDVPKYVLRFWEDRFPQIRPMKRGGGRRYYRPEDMELLRGIRQLLRSEGYTIKGVQKILREQGVEHVKLYGRGTPPAGEAIAAEPVKVKKRGQGRGATSDQSWATAEVDAALAGEAATGTRSRRQTIEEAITQLEKCRALLKSAMATELPAKTSRRARSGAT